MRIIADLIQGTRQMKRELKAITELKLNGTDQERVIGRIAEAVFPHFCGSTAAEINRDTFPEHIHEAHIEIIGKLIAASVETLMPADSQEHGAGYIAARACKVALAEMKASREREAAEAAAQPINGHKH